MDFIFGSSIALFFVDIGLVSNNWSFVWLEGVLESVCIFGDSKSTDFFECNVCGNVVCGKEIISYLCVLEKLYPIRIDPFL